MNQVITPSNSISGNGTSSSWFNFGTGLLSSSGGLRAILDSAQDNLLVADLSFKLIYANPKAVLTLKNIESDIMESFGVRVEEFLGGSIHRFHKDPQRIENILKNPNSFPHEAQFSFGNITLKTIINGVFNKSNKLMGYVVNWEDVSEKMKQEARVAQIHSMVENAPVNIMFADMDLKIQYLNPASVKTLKKLEHLLPVSADKMMGQNIDIFHKDPSHQRRLLADPKNLPHQANIKVGPETLDLLVSPIYDQNDEYVGPMVTWSVITEKLALEQKEKENNENMERILNLVAQNAKSLLESANKLSSTSESLAISAGEAETRATTVETNSDVVNQNVQTVATGSEEMSASIQEISQNATQAAQVSASAVGVAQTTNATISELGESSQEIGKVLKVITQIAEQTNLLALNATIEAARAGEAGKGFAVVANEVKELAKQTADATEDIGQKIQDIQTKTEGAVEAISEISGIINQINDISASIASAVEEQSATTNEMTRNVTDASVGVSEISTNIKGVSSAVGNTAQAAQETQVSAEQLSRLANELEALVNEFQGH